MIAAPDYAAAAVLLPWLVPAALLAQMYIFAPGIAIERRTVWQLALSFASAVVSAGLNTWLIPRWGALGAAVATCAAAALFFGLWLVASQRLYPLPLRGGALMASLATYLLLLTAGARLDGLVESAVLRTSLKCLGLLGLAGVLLGLGLIPWRQLLRRRWTGLS